MKLKSWDWNAQRFDEIEYPDAPIKAFIDWLRTTKQWREDPDQVFAKFLRFQAELEEAKADAEKHPRCSVATKAGTPCQGKPVKDGLCMAHLKAAQAA